MNIIKIENQNGYYPPIQTWSQAVVPNGYAVIPDYVDTSVFYEYNGFVNLEIVNNIVNDMTANVEAWENWKASLPEVTEKPVKPSQLDIIEAQVTYTAMMTDTLLEV